MRSLLARRKVGRLALVAFALVCVVVAVVLVPRPSAPPPAATLHEPFSRPLAFRDRLAGWIPGASSSFWRWRLGNSVFGQRKPVNIYADVLALSEPTSAGLVSSLALEKPVFAEPNGLQVWFLRSGDVKAVHERLKRTPGIDSLGRPRICMADGVEASIFSGPSVPLNGVVKQVGLKMDCFARVRSRSTELFAVITLSEAVTNQMAAATTSPPANSISIRTNLDIKARLQIPKGSGVLLVKHSPDDPNHRTFGVVIDPP